MNQQLYQRSKKSLTKLLCFTLVGLFFFTDLATFLINIPNIIQVPTVVKTAEALSGDFSIYREVTAGDAVTTTPLDVTWDTTVIEQPGIELQGDNSSIDLATGGKYLVLYNVWTNEGAGGTNRRAFETFLTINNTEIPYGRGDGYIRDSGGDNDAYNAGATIIEATAGDNLEVNIARHDSNGTAAAGVRPGTNGVSVLKLNDTFDYLRVTKNSDVSDISSNTTFTDVVWDQNDEVDTGSFGFTNGSSSITLKGDAGAHFLLTTNVGILQTAGSSVRQNYEMVVTLDGVEIPGSKVTTYPRGGNGVLEGNLVYSGIIQKTAAGDQTLNIEVRRESQGTAATRLVAADTALAMVALPSTANYISLTSTGADQTYTNTASAFAWNDQIEVDTASFSHDISTNNNRINFDAASDYLFFSTTYTSRTTNTARNVPVIEWRLDGSTTIPYGGHGSFNRGDQGTTDSYTSGSSGGIILDGITDTQFLEVTKRDEAIASPNAVFPAGEIAVQGVDLNSLFRTDVEVTSSGAQVSEVLFPSTGNVLGGQFIITENSSSRNITSVTFTESGTIDGATGLDNIELQFDLDTTAPHDCVSESFDGNETKYGLTDVTGFSAADGLSSFSDSVIISTTQAFCGYLVYDITDQAADGETVLISIANPSTDVTVTSGGTVGPGGAVSPTGDTTIENPELTQTHVRWLEDDGTEGGATAIEAEDTPATGFAVGTTRRLRTQVHVAGSTTTDPITYRLEYAEQAGTCEAVTAWTDVGAGGGEWDMSASSFITEGNDTTNIGTGSGGLTDPSGGVFLTPNGGLRDLASETGALTLDTDEFVEMEWSIVPTGSAVEGTTYCFRVSDSGNDLRNYNVFAEGTLSADVTVGAIGSHVTAVNVGSSDNELDGVFTVQKTGVNRSITSITLTATGTADLQNDIDNIRLFFDMDTSTPHDCVSESFVGTESQFGSTDTDGFSVGDNQVTFSDVNVINPTRSICFYLVYDVASTATDGETFQVFIDNPSEDVSVNLSTIGPSSAVAPSGITTFSGPVRTQTGYHWRNDDGAESGATSATAGVQNTALTNVVKERTLRLRTQIHNDGAVAAAGTEYRLEFGTKVTTCDVIVTWTDVGALGGAFDMSPTANLVEGANTTNIATGIGGVSDPGGSSFLSANTGVHDINSQTGSITLASNEVLELEWALEPTQDAGSNTDYCFRVTDVGAELEVYEEYAELTTLQNQDYFIQRGVETVTGNSLTLTAGVDYVAPAASSSAFIRITNTQITGGGLEPGGGTQNADDVTVYISNPENITNNITFERPATAINNTRVAWEIIEYIGLPGADNEMKVRGHGTVTYGTGALSVTGAVSDAVDDDSDIVVFITGQLNPDGGTNDYNTGISTAEWNSGSDQPVFTRGETGGDAVELSYAVVEFTGANWNIQRVEHEYATAGAVETESITAVGNINTTFLHTQKRVGAGQQGLDDMGQQVFLSSVGQVSFELENTVGTPSEHTAVVWVIENTQTGAGALTVYRSNGRLIASACGVEPCIENVNIGGTLQSESNGSIFGTNSSTGEGTAFPRPIIALRLISTTQYEAWRSDHGQNEDFRVEVVEWPIAELALRQNAYRFYVDNDAIDPIDPWPVGAADVGENTPVTILDEPIGEGEVIRIRMTLNVNNASLPQNTESFKLQFGRITEASCSAIADWTDIGGVSSGSIWRGFNGTPEDGTALSTDPPAAGALNISVADVAGTYEEANNTALNPFKTEIGEDVEYDWVIQHNGAIDKSDYCFRMVFNDGAELTAYDNYPQLRTAGYAPVISQWRWFDDEVNETPTVPLAAENVAPTNIDNLDVIKLRTSIAEIDGASGNNINFKLQYSEYADFSAAVFDVSSASLCTATSTWCYADGGGVDKATITTAVLSDTDSCAAGVGDGCGFHVESTTTPATPFTHGARDIVEFDFTIQQRGARANAVYFFRLFDIGNDDVVLASTTFPSLNAAGPSLTFSVSGRLAGQSVEGIVTDVTTTPTAVPFGSVPFDTEHEAAHTLSVETNATEGFQLLQFARQDLLNQYGTAIPAIASTNAAPSGWSTACLLGATGCFGYHTGDDTLAGGSTRFAADDSYAALSTNPAEVMFSSVPVNAAVDVVYKVQVREGQPAGDYDTEIVYLVIPSF